MLDVSVVVPFYKGIDSLARCLGALQRAAARLEGRAEVVVSADGAVDDATAVAAANGARLLRFPGPRGPAVARNRAAAETAGAILVFVDADVVVHDDAIVQIAQFFEREPGVDAVFGSYDDRPADPGLVSRTKNLAHAFIHNQSERDAVTFWAGLGAIRREAFVRVGGFDERFARPSVEDIELGYRLNAAGCRIAIEPAIRGTHLKRWSVGGAVVSDLLDRGIPWTQLILRRGARNDMNIAYQYRVCVVLSFVTLAALALVWMTPWTLAVAAAAVAAIGAIEFSYLAFVASAEGWGVAVGALLLRVLHHLASGVAFVVGAVLHVAQRTFGLSLPGALPVDAWPAGGHQAAPSGER